MTTDKGKLNVTVRLKKITSSVGPSHLNSIIVSNFLVGQSAATTDNKNITWEMVPSVNLPSNKPQNDAQILTDVFGFAYKQLINNY